jgi:hypothetical protein
MTPGWIKTTSLIRVVLACSLFLHFPGRAADDPDCKSGQTSNAAVLHRLREPSVTFGSTEDIEHDMVAGTITFRIDGTALDPAEFVSEKGQRFTVADGKGAERWELKGRVTQQADHTYLFDALIKCADAVVARQKITTKPEESVTIKVDGRTCPGKRKTFEADAKFLSMPGTKAAVVEAPSFKVVFKVYVDEHGTPKSVQFLRREPSLPMSKDELDEMASTVLTWTFDSARGATKGKAGYVIVPMMVN